MDVNPKMKKYNEQTIGLRARAVMMKQFSTNNFRDRQSPLRTVSRIAICNLWK